MKTAIYIEDGVVQLVITPESEFERSSLASFSDKSDFRFWRGSFYNCAGGWYRHASQYDDSDKSLILQMKTAGGQST